jgi:hypothetical protein
MRHSEKASVLVVSALSAMVAACAGTLDDPGRFSDLTGDPSPARTATKPCSDGSVILAQKCGTAGCHSSADHAGDLDLASPGVSSRVLDRPSKTGGLLVDPNAPQQSLIYQRIQPTAAGRMPVFGDPLDDDTIACLLTWMSGLPAVASVTSTPSSSGAIAADAKPTTASIIRVAAGATAPYTDTSGNVWSADTGFTGGTSGLTNPPGTVSGTMDPTLYNGQRWGQDAVTLNGMTFAYSFDVPNGTYEVTLMFAELYAGITGPGKRLFNVAINGQTVLTNFDIFAEANGRDVALDKKFTVAATGKVLIEFTQGTANFAKIDAIVIAPKAL